MSARGAAVLVAAAGWHALWLLAGRADGVGVATTLALLAALGWSLGQARHLVGAGRLMAVLLASGAPYGRDGAICVEGFCPTLY
ncbi:hypothetical protein [Sphingomonas endolithica]|uniref:hypothetical protein n=1 Tax=Sphingomonas endolithica TaxID=2972485 RepID=UPI0021AE7C41|nr:hypothetical protein [Sphingomonas sp. ZFBP2030]